MKEDYDWEIHQLLADQIEDQIELIIYNLSLLQEIQSRPAALDELFRYFHTYKSSSAYLKLTPLNDLVSKTEVVLSALREKKKPIQSSVLEWLQEVGKQLSVYLEEMQNNQNQLTDIPSHLLNKLKITTPYVDYKKKLKSLSVLYMDGSISRAKKIVPFLQKYVKSVQHSTEADASNTVLNLSIFEIIIVNLGKENQQTIDFCQSNYPNVALIPIFDKLSGVELHRLLKKGITHSIENPLSAKSLYAQLISIVKAYYSSANLIIEHKQISQFIETMQPLPKTLFEIIRICDDDESSISELIKVVKVDPIISANILKAANSPIYGSVELKTIDQAVTKFGKRAIKALSMSDVYNSVGEINLSAYGITEETFSNIARMRLSLMLKWYAKVSIADLSLLSSTAILGNIGQLLISKELLQRDENEHFKELCEVFDTKYAEEFILNTTTSYVSSKILRFLKLSADIVDIIEHSDNPKDASPDLQKLCAVNYIVNSLVNVNGNIAQDISDELLDLMKEYKLNIGILEKSLKSIKEVVGV